MGAKAAAAEEKSPSREICDSDQATTSDKISQPNLAAAEQNFYEFRARWITRLEKCTDDWALKTELLETLEDAYLAPVCDLSEKDFSEVKDMFFQGFPFSRRISEEAATTANQELMAFCDLF